jgi:1-acyl-sn-glycerol-3-phosphate acyltransferase
MLRKLYACWCLFWFVLIFLLLYPFFLLFMLRESWHRYTADLYRVWAAILFPLCGIKIITRFEFKAGKNTPYVYCPNHSSYLDIPIAAFTVPGFYAFIGKKELSNVPLFGYKFRKLHIPIDRGSRVSGYQILQKASEAIDKGRGIIIFPEGKVDHTIQPGLLPFKDGAFRIAIEKQIPVVPVTIPYNWIILPDDGKYRIQKHDVLIIFHEPIPTTGMTIEDLPMLKQKTFDVIAATLEQYFPNKCTIYKDKKINT